jgi:hypothetical protein
MSVDLRGLVKSLAYEPLLLIYSVVGSVPTEAWADPQRVSKCGSPLRGGADCGGRALPTTIEYMQHIRL